jgi:hypothetical protein
MPDGRDDECGDPCVYRQTTIPFAPKGLTMRGNPGIRHRATGAGIPAALLAADIASALHDWLVLSGRSEDRESRSELPAGNRIAAKLPPIDKVPSQRVHSWGSKP